jgi:hypothetical protein
MTMFSALFINNACCDKSRIRTSIYKLYGTHLSYEYSVKIYICTFIVNLIGTDIVLRTQLVPFLLHFFFGSFISLTGIAFFSNAFNIYLLISLYGEIKHLIKTVNCKCLTHTHGGTDQEPVANAHVD